MFRKLTLAAAAALSLSLTALAPTSASAGGFWPHHHHHHRLLLRRLVIHLGDEFGMRHQVGVELLVARSREIAEPRRAEDAPGRDDGTQKPRERGCAQLGVQRRFSLIKGVTIATMSFARCHSAEPSGSSLAARLAKTSVAGLLEA